MKRPGRKALFAGAQTEIPERKPEKNAELIKFIDEFRRVSGEYIKGNTDARLKDSYSEKDLSDIASLTNSILDISSEKSSEMLISSDKEEEYKQKISELEARINEQISVKEKEIGILKQEIKEYEQNKPEISGYESDIQSLKEKTEELKDIIKELESENKNLKDLLNEKDSLIDKFKKDISSIRKKIEEEKKVSFEKGLNSGREEKDKEISDIKRSVQSENDKFYKKGLDKGLEEKNNEINRLKMSFEELKGSVFDEGYNKGAEEGYERGSNDGYKRGNNEGYERGTENSKDELKLKNDKIEELSLLLKDNKKIIDNLNEKITSKESELSVKSSETEEIKSQLRGKESEVKAIESELAEKNAEIEKIKLQLEEKNNETELINSLLSEKISETEEIKSRLTKRDSETEETVSQLAEINNENKIIREQLEEIRTQLEEKSRETEEIRTQLEEKSRETEETVSQLAEINNENKIIREQLEEKSRETEEIRTQLEEKSRETEETVSQLAEINNENKIIREQLEEKSRETEETVSQLAEINNENKIIREQLEEKSRETEEIRTLISEKELEINKLKSELQESNSGYQIKESELTEKDSRIRKTESELAELKEKYENLRESAYNEGFSKGLNEAENKNSDEIRRFNIENENIASGFRDLKEELKRKEELFDIKREELENNIKRTENRFETVIKENPMPALLLDNNLRIIQSSREFEKLSSLNEYRLTGRNIGEFKITVLKGDKLSSVIERKTPADSEIKIQFPSGEHILNQHAIPLKERDGTISGVILICNDITSTREKEEILNRKLRQNEELKKRSETIVQENPMPILLVDNKFNIIVTNNAYENMSGISRQKLLKMNARDFKLVSQEGEGLNTAFKNKKRSYGEVTVDLPSGRHILEQYAIPVPDSNGNVNTLLIVYNEITKIRAKEREIQELMEKSRTEAKKLSESAELFRGRMKLIASGDLTVSAEITEDDPLYELKTDFNNSINEINSLLINVGKNIDLIDETSGELSGNSRKILSATEKLAANSGESAESNSKIIDLFGEISMGITDLSASIEEISGTSQEVMEQAKKVTEEGKSAAEIGKNASGKIENVGIISKKSVDEINALNEEMYKINDIVRLIAGIAEQTNLLALNAAIEAARAGEHGRGFSVVAEEIRNLARESKGATRNIEDLIAEIQKNSEKTTESMKKVDEEITDSIGSVNLAIDALNNIVNDIGGATTGIIEITKATENQADETNKFLENIEKANRMADKNLRSVKSISDFAEDINASTEEVSSISHELHKMSADLEGMMKKFKLKSPK
ncbi:methyl-accepting chemotaxis sensory transducer with Pas/Pac sensor [Methanoplanus limicola DSM 2279]|uniref:Methyl-accepting chemotaxis sensory transducer with Pas/Pac sensor n=2 Tax=Methanoplanus limicola TaxID=2315 RepID=H1YXT6_9EURY|nr:methyl-accepting chemotaxis sensory transducer with Pas/Pac sensor [Methanoplanus limicola DSM 2279]